jgi:hypothetical protein
MGCLAGFVVRLYKIIAGSDLTEKLVKGVELSEGLRPGHIVALHVSLSILQKMIL